MSRINSASALHDRQAMQREPGCGGLAVVNLGHELRRHRADPELIELHARARIAHRRVTSTG